MEHKPRKYENLVNFVNLATEGFTAQTASSGSNMPNKNTTIHTLNGFEKAGLLTATKEKNGKVFTKTEAWAVDKAITTNKERIRLKMLKRKPKLKAEKKQEAKSAKTKQKQKA